MVALELLDFATLSPTYAGYAGSKGCYPYRSPRDNTPRRGVIPDTGKTPRDNTPSRGVIPRTSGTKVEEYYYTRNFTRNLINLNDLAG